MTYEETINYIHSIPKFVRPLGNKNLGLLLERLGNPQDKMRFVHIAGTNGKGSTAAMLAQMLHCAGYKTGLFTSPYIVRFNERIQINRENISDEALAEIAERVRDAMGDDSVSEFAFITAAAFVYFYEQKCDITVLETGMGGRLDATNIIKSPLVSVLTSISLDHTRFLGDTIEEIAEEKCGIIKESCPVVSYPNYSVRAIIERKAKEKHSRLVFAGVPKKIDGGFIYKGEEYKLSLGGTYQPNNAAVAVETARVLNLPETSVKEGLAETEWTARFEYLRKNLIIDGAHNPDGIRELKKALKSLNQEIVIVAAMMKDKACRECMEELGGIAKKIITTELDTERCESAENLAKFCGGTAIDDPMKALKHAMEIVGGGVVCVCGSLYLAGEVKKEIGKE